MSIDIFSLSSSVLYFDITKSHTELIKSCGFDGVLVPVRILDIKEASYPIERDKSEILIFKVVIIELKFLLSSSWSIAIPFSKSSRQEYISSLSK